MTARTVENLMLLAAGAGANLAVVWGVLRHELKAMRGELSAMREHLGLPTDLGRLP